MQNVTCPILLRPCRHVQSRRRNGEAALCTCISSPRSGQACGEAARGKAEADGGLAVTVSSLGVPRRNDPMAFYQGYRLQVEGGDSSSHLEACPPFWMPHFARGRQIRKSPRFILDVRKSCLMTRGVVPQPGPGQFLTEMVTSINIALVSAPLAHASHKRSSSAKSSRLCWVHSLQ